MNDFDPEYLYGHNYYFFALLKKHFVIYTHSSAPFPDDCYQRSKEVNDICYNYVFNLLAFLDDRYSLQTTQQSIIVAQLATE